MDDQSLTPAPPQNGQPLQAEVAHEYSVNELRIIKDRGLYAVTLPIMIRIPYTDAATSSYYSTPAFIANRPYQIVQIVSRFTSASSAGSAEFGVYNSPNGGGSAVSVTSSSYGFPLTGTSNTNFVVTKDSSVHINSDSTSLILAGDAISLITNKTPTNCQGVTVAILLRGV